MTVLLGSWAFKGRERKEMALFRVLVGFDKGGPKICLPIGEALVGREMLRKQGEGLMD